MIEGKPYRFKTYVKYDSLDELFSRKEVILNTTKNALERESREDYNYTLIDSQITANKDNYILEILIEKTIK